MNNITYLPSPGPSVVTPRNVLNAAAISSVDLQAMFAAADSPVRIIYGMPRIGARVVTTLPYLLGAVIFVLWGYGECDSVVSYTIDDKAAPPGVTAQHYMGTQTQTVDPLLVLAFNANGVPGFADALLGKCYSVFYVPSNVTPGFPRIAAVIKGLKVYDSRLDSTNGGSGSQRLATPTTWTWSDTPALCTANFMANTVYGAGKTMLWSSVASVANDNEALIGGLEKHRTLNLCIDKVMKTQDWIDTLRTYAGCWALNAGADMKLVSDKATASVATISHTSGHIRSLTNLNLSGSQNVPSKVIVYYTDTSTIPHQDKSVVVTDGTANKRYSTVYLLGINRHSQAVREATERLNKLSLSDLSFNLGTFAQHGNLEFGDVITVNWPGIGITSKLMRVGNTSGSYGHPDFALTEYDPAFYDASVVAAPTYPDTTLPDPMGAVAAPTAINITETLFAPRDGAKASMFAVTWTDATDFYPLRHFVTISDPTSIINSGAGIDGAYSFGPLQDGVVYTISVYAERESTHIRSSALTDTKTALGKLLKPGDVATFSAAAGQDGVTLAWGQIYDIDMKGYAVQEAASWTTGAPSYKEAGQNDTNTKLGFVAIGAHAYLIKSLDWSGNEAVNAASCNITISAPAQPVPAATISGPNVVIAWPAVASSYPVDRYEIREGASWAAGTPVATSYALSTTVRVASVGALNFFVAAVDAAGNVSSAGMASVNISAPLTPTATIEIIDNNVLLRWSDATTTLPIANYEIRKGASWAAGTLIGTLLARFSAIFESTAGTYTYWVAATDVAGNQGTPAQVSATVAQPPDFQLLFDVDSTLAGTSTNFFVENGVMTGPVNEAETFQEHFVNNSWTTPQDQINAGYPIYIEPGLTTGVYEEVWDYGSTAASALITATIDSAVVVGSVTATPTISVSNTSSTGPWTDYAGSSQAYAAAFRWIKVRYDFAGAGGANLLSVSRINLRMSFKLRNDAGMASAVSTDAGGTVVAFNIAYVDVQSIQVSPQGTVNLTAVYDFVDAINPTSFKVLLFDAAGARVSGPFSWSAKGV